MLQHALSGTIRRVKIDPSPTLGVRAFMMRKADAPDWRDQVTILAAGPVAEARISGWQTYPCEMQDHYPDRHTDCARIAAIASENAPEQPGEAYQTAFAEASELLSRILIWRAVLDLAGRLLQARIMPGADAHAIIETHIIAGSLVGFRRTYDFETDE